jgi:hypothetical protein
MNSAANRDLVTGPGIVRYFQLDRRQLVYLKFIQEAYEGLSFMSTADRQQCIVRISYQPAVAADMEGLLTALAGEIALQEVAAPPPPGVHDHA